MSHWKFMNHRLQSLTLSTFKRICCNYDIFINDNDLKIILCLIKNNPYPILNEEYFPILFFKISKETNEKISNLFKPIIEKQYLIKEIAKVYS